MIEKKRGNHTSLLSSHPFISALVFFIGLICFEFIFLSQSRETSALASHYKDGLYLRLLGALFFTVISLVLTGFFIWAAFISPYKYRVFYFIVFCLAVFTEYSYQGVFNRFTIFSDVETAFVAADWQIRENAVLMYLNFLAVIPCLIFGFFLSFLKPILKNGGAVMIICLLLFGVFFCFTSYFTHNTFVTASTGAYFRTAIDFPLSWYIGSVYTSPRRGFYNAKRQEVTFRTREMPVNNIVFIVDESVRGDHLSLNGYAKPTSAFLEQLNEKGLMQNWGLAVSGTTCSTSSNNLMLTGLTELPGLDFKIYKLPTIFQYAKAAGYKTMSIDGQVSNIWNGKPADYFFVDDRLTIDDFRGKKKFEIDADIARRVKHIVENSTGNFIWINKSGVHIPYRFAYPQSEAVFLPVSDTIYNNLTYYNLSVSPTEIINDYDNAVRFNVNSFFTNLIGETIPQNTFFIYTSDHGQTLLEDGKKLSHCLDSKAEAIVPLFILAAPQDLPKVDTGFKASHSNIFAALLDLMKFPEKERKYNYALSLLKAKTADSQPRYYFAGDLHDNSFIKYLYDEQNR